MFILLFTLLLLSYATEVKTQSFDVEVSRLMHLIIHSLYTNKEIFLRELISNSADALDKLRFLSLTDSSLNVDTSELHIRVSTDAESGTIIIEDNGIGMNKTELQTHLGTISKSGTSEFLSALEQTDDKTLIGQFGVGFYSSFLVAENVTVYSRKAGDSNTYYWRSNGEGFIVGDAPEDNQKDRQGTSVVLELKEKYFLDDDVLNELVTKYSEFIQFPIEMKKVVKTETEVIDEEATNKAALEAAEKLVEEGDNREIEEIVKDELEKIEPIMKYVTNNETVWNVVNTNKPIWMRSDVSDEEYDEFYKSLTRDSHSPLTHIHFSTEGDSVFRALLFIPSNPPNPLASPEQSKAERLLRLYVRRVFVSGEFANTLPDYLSFIKGVVDSDDLPLNVGRELVQENRHIDRIKRKIVRKVLQLVQNLADNEPETFANFLKSYETQLKIGAITDVPNRGRIAKLLRYASSEDTNGNVSFADYNQTNIYYICSDSVSDAESSPLSRGVVNAGYEVLYMTEAVDEAATKSIGSFDGMNLVDIAKDGLDILVDTDDVYDGLKEFIKKTIPDITKVQVSPALGDIAAAVISDKEGLSANMEKLIKAHAGANRKDFNLNDVKRVLLINGNHKIIQILNDLVSMDNTVEAQKVVRGIYNTALLQAGYSIRDTNEYSLWVQDLMEQQLTKLGDNEGSATTKETFDIDEKLEL
ncbi:90 kDa heat shock protein [Entamoeba marina]